MFIIILQIFKNHIRFYNQINERIIAKIILNKYLGAYKCDIKKQIKLMSTINT